MKRHTISYVSFFAAALFALTACSDGAITGRHSMEPVAVLDYEVPAALPSVLTDLTGYSQNAEKYAYLRINDTVGKVDRFSIVDLDQNRVIYEGSFTEAKGNEDLLIADFSDVTSVGRYRIECETYGCSEEFGIMADKYGSFSVKYRDLIMEDLRDLSATSQTVLEFLQAYEWYYADNVDENMSSETVLPDAPEELVAVRDWISGSDYSESVGTEAVIYAAILAKFSFLYKDYDSSLATECLQKASSIYSQSNSVLKSDSESFRALAELYRASGESAYYNELSGYKEYFSSNPDFLNNGYMYGAMTYIVTRQAVDKELCDMLVNAILSKAQTINNRRREITDPMFSQTSGREEMLDYLRVLLSANYILQGYEYDMTVQRCLHYLAGLNVESDVYEPEANNEGVYFLVYSCMAELEREGKFH